MFGIRFHFSCKTKSVFHVSHKIDAIGGEVRALGERFKTKGKDTKQPTCCCMRSTMTMTIIMRYV
jgi:hypothetical protein